MAGPEEKNVVVRTLEAGILCFIFIFVFAAPHSIAAAQTAWLVAMTLWLLRFAFKPRPKIYSTPLDYFILGFFILTGISAFLSYEPMVSIGKLRAASLFTIIYLIVENVPSLKVVRVLAVLLISSCMVNVVMTVGDRIIGRGVKVHGLTENSVLFKAGVRDGDTLLTLDGQKLEDPQGIVDGLSRPNTSPAELQIYRHEWQPTFKVARGNVLTGNSPLEQLGIGSWTRGRDWRASGFFGHYVTYAEVLQLILALTLGLFATLPNKRSLAGGLLLIALIGLAFSLLMTVTRAVWMGCLFSSAIILTLTIRRRTMIILAALAVPLMFAGLYVLQQKRNVGFFDSQDASTTWRETVWRGGFHLLISKPRHLLIGVGMDSIKAHWKQWGLFDGGRIPTGHMHSNFLQIALERGLPALILWINLLFVYARTIWRTLRAVGSDSGWMEKGVLVGALGGLVGFFVSGVVHYNWGDSEVVMVLYLLMGLVLTIHREIRQNNQS